MNENDQNSSDILRRITRLTPEEANLRFEQLQLKLVPLWESIQQLSMDEQTIFV